MGNTAKKFIPANREKLIKELNKKGLTIYKASIGLGYSESTLQKQLSTYKGLTEQNILLIESVFHIPRSLFIEDNPVFENECRDETNKLLRDVIENQKYLLEGQTDMLHMMERLEDTIFKAVDKAWRQ